MFVRTYEKKKQYHYMKKYIFLYYIHTVQIYEHDTFAHGRKSLNTKSYKPTEFT